MTIKKYIEFQLGNGKVYTLKNIILYIKKLKSKSKLNFGVITN